MGQSVFWCFLWASFFWMWFYSYGMFFFRIRTANLHPPQRDVPTHLGVPLRIINLWLSAVFVFWSRHCSRVSASQILACCDSFGITDWLYSSYRVTGTISLRGKWLHWNGRGKRFLAREIFLWNIHNLQIPPRVWLGGANWCVLPRPHEQYAQIKRKVAPPLPSNYVVPALVVSKCGYVSAAICGMWFNIWPTLPRLLHRLNPEGWFTRSEIYFFCSEGKAIVIAINWILLFSYLDEIHYIFLFVCIFWLAFCVEQSLFHILKLHCALYFDEYLVYLYLYY